MTVRVLTTARRDLADGFWFYGDNEAGLGDYFLAGIYEDLVRLRDRAGVHRNIPDGSFRMNTRKFHHAIYYRIRDEVAEVHAIIDCRRSPEWIRDRLSKS